MFRRNHIAGMMRRNLLRMLRLQNLLMLTVIVILLYLLKMMSNLEFLENNGHTQEALQASDSIRDSSGYFVPKSLKKKDWHDYALISQESKRVGIGEQGRPAYLSKEESDLEEKLYAVNGFNGALSDKISLNRSLPDIRHPKCRQRQYLAELPAVSVVVPFHDEHWSTLLRTALGVLRRSPPHLVKEIFLVDDASTKEFLGGALERWAARLPAVRVVRLARRRGLIAARLAGARLASADVLVFLDSHTEPNVNWLPPLLEPIALDGRTVACPYIDVVAFDTLEYRAQDAGARGAFDWELFYKRLPLLPRDEANLPEPFESPVMAGGLFAISRAFFWELGGYDPGLDIWGGEQYELSFKIWQCGGRMVDVPCSRVGHIYRKFAPFPNPGHGDFVGKNYRRVADVWMDEWARFVYARRPQYARLAPGDLAAQHALRARLRCKPFSWFMSQVAFDLTAKYPPVEPKPFAEGRIRPESAPALCVDAAHGAQMAALQLRRCAAPDAETRFVLSWHRDIRSATRAMCWDVPAAAPRSAVRLYACHLGGGNQLWRYLPESKQIKHGSNDICVEFSLQPAAVFVNKCAAGPAQRWRLDAVDAAALAAWARPRAPPTGPAPPPPL